MNNEIRKYLNELKEALKKEDPAVVQDALWDAEMHLKNSLDNFANENPDVSVELAFEKIVETYGTPAEVAQAYLDREKIVQAAMPRQDSGRWPSFFGIFKTPKAYSSLLYLLISLPVGVFFFTWAVTGISLSLGLMILIIGIPFAIAFLGTVRLLALAEGRVVEALLDVRMPRRPRLLPEGQTVMERLKNLLLEGQTWSSIAYLILHLPLGIFYFVTMVTGLAVSLSLICAPFLKWFIATGVIMATHSVFPPLGILLLSPIAGFFLLVATMHAAYGLGRLHGLIAKAMLVKK